MERCIQTIKNLLKKSKSAHTDFELALLAYRNTKLSDLNATPAQLLMSRTLRSHMPVLPKFLAPSVIPSRKKQMIRQHKLFKVGDGVRYWTHDKQWKTGIIVNTGLQNKHDYIIKNSEN